MHTMGHGARHPVPRRYLRRRHQRLRPAGAALAPVLVLVSAMCYEASALV